MAKLPDKKLKPPAYTTTASYDSPCPGCGEDIHEGDKIVRHPDDDCFVCEICGEDL